MSTQRHTFAHDVRVLLCPSCAGPYEVPPSGGMVKCTYCGASASVSARRGNLASDSGLSESQRFEKLRAQDRKPPPPPSSLSHYFHGAIEPARTAKAMAEWQEARRQVADGAPFLTAESLYYLTVYLVGVHVSEPETQRGLLETALETLEDRRHRQVLSAMMSRHAARLGEIDDAEAWLAVCDARSDDLRMDTAWRHARAFLDTVRGEYDKVLETVGSGLNDLPIADAEEDAIGVLRANAHEKQGDVAKAREQLTTLAHRSAAGSSTLAKVLEANAGLGLCEQSGPAVLAAVPARQAGVLQRPGLGSLALSLLFPGMFAGGALAFFAAGAFGLMLANLGLAIGMAIGGFAFLLVALVATVVAIGAWRFRRAAVTAPGEILSVSGNPVRVNNRPLLSVTVRVVPAEGEPFVAETRTTVPPAMLSQLAPGMAVTVAHIPGRSGIEILWD